MGYIGNILLQAVERILSYFCYKFNVKGKLNPSYLELSIKITFSKCKMHGELQHIPETI